MIGRMYPAWVERTVNGTDDYAGASFVALLLKSAYSFSTSHIFITDLTPASTELTGGGYARITPSGMLISRTGSAVTITFNPIVFPLITASGTNAPRSMVLAKVGVSDASSPLVFQQDFEIASDVSGADVAITPSPSGFIRYTSTP